MTILFIRTCQSCFNRISVPKENQPIYGKEPSDSYKEKKCPKCKSRDFDYGSEKNVDEKTLEDIYLNNE